MARWMLTLIAVVVLGWVQILGTTGITWAKDVRPILPGDQPAGRDKPRPPVILVRPDPSKPSEPLQVSALNLHVIVNGPLAQVTQTMTFHNPNGRPLEGELVFPLPEGATVSGYALDIPAGSGELVEAVVVEKDEARIAFETEV